MQIILRQKAIWAIFLFEFKMGCKATETTHNSTFGSGTSNEPTAQWWFKKVCKIGESLEDEERSGQPSEVDNNREPSLKLILLQVHEKLPRNSTSTILWSFNIWSKLERWGGLANGCLMHCPQNKNYCFEVLPSLILCNNEPFLKIVTWWKVDFIW